MEDMTGIDLVGARGNCLVELLDDSKVFDLGKLLELYSVAEKVAMLEKTWVAEMVHMKVAPTAIC
jgi:hypothetical protein